MFFLLLLLLFFLRIVTTCAADSSVTPSWPSVDGGTVASITCGNGWYSAIDPTRTCYLNGTWSSTINNSCVGKKHKHIELLLAKGFILSVFHFSSSCSVPRKLRCHNNLAFSSWWYNLHWNLRIRIQVCIIPHQILQSNKGQRHMGCHF